MYLPHHPIRAAIRGAKALATPTSPMLVQMVVTRRCNLSCGYCNEYDDVSDPIPTAELEERIDYIASLGTLVLTFTGGEPLLHPDLDRLVARAVSHGIVVTTITNGYPVTKRWIERLNKAKLSWVQISIDNLVPNDVSQKSFSKIKHKLELLRDHADFGINVNAVLGSSPTQDTRTLVDEVEKLGAYMTVGLMHGPTGELDPGLAGDELASLHAEMQERSNKTIFHFAGEGWEKQMIRAGSSAFKCRAGSRYLYVDEFGKVSYCSQRRGDPGIPLLQYTKAMMQTAFDAPKGCESRCTIACVRRASAFDGIRGQNGAPASAVKNGHLPVIQS